MSSFKLFCIGYGNAYDHAVLKKICKWANDDEVEFAEDDVVIPLIHTVLNKGQLEQIYGDINKDVDVVAESLKR